MKNWNWLNKPVTWRSYLRASAWSMLICCIAEGIYYTIYFWDEITDKLDDLTCLIHDKLNRE